jgi:hypothetical protein
MDCKTWFTYPLLLLAQIIFTKKAITGYAEVFKYHVVSEYESVQDNLRPFRQGIVLKQYNNG